jgi:hypothetical protein
VVAEEMMAAVIPAEAEEVEAQLQHPQEKRL